MLSSPWHAKSIDSTISLLKSSLNGLSQSEATKRLAVHGPNVLPAVGPTPAWRVFTSQFCSPLIYVLLAAAAVSVFIGEFEDASFIAAVLLINAGIGSYQEYHAERSSLALRKLLSCDAHVLREGEIRQIPAEQIVPGDLVWLESGSRVPGDARLVFTQNMEVDESMLTGESLAVTKSHDWQGGESTPIADRANMAMAGSMVMRGRGKGVVVATGLQTNIGQVATDVTTVSAGRPPLLERIERFTNRITIATVCASLLIGLLAVFVAHYSLLDTFFLIVALAVSAIPEGLPVAITVALSVAAIRMARRNVIVRRLAAVEGLGSCTLIATDKTGTLTCNELTVRELQMANQAVAHVTGEGFSTDGIVTLDPGHQDQHSQELLQQIARAGVLCNEASLNRQNDGWTTRGDAVDIALLCLGHKLGLQRQRLLERYPQLNQLPFESEHQFAATYHLDQDHTLVCVKGSPERVVSMCQGAAFDQEQHNIVASMAERGLRVLAVATGTLPQRLQVSEVPPWPSHLKLLGFVGLIDPLRATASDAVQTCHAAGVRVVMITGDHRDTAIAIAREIGLLDRDDQVMTGPEVAKLLDQELIAAVQRARVFARVTPGEKLRIVNAIRDAGHFVAVTGDGVNDAPAIRTANIGVAMGKMGTDVAREAADLVISDDNFASIVAGIDEGRIAYDNIRKVIFLLTSMGAAELLMVLLAVSTGVPVPLLPVQLLWLNIVTDGIQGVALAFEPGEDNTLRRPPRSPQEPIFDRLMIERMVISVSVVGIGGFLCFFIALQCGWSIKAARNLLLLVMVLFENFHVGNCRSETTSAFRLAPHRSPILLIGTLAALGVHICGMSVPLFQSILSTEPLSAKDWAIALVAAFSVVPAIELHKWWWARRTAVQSLPVNN